MDESKSTFFTSNSGQYLSGYDPSPVLCLKPIKEMDLERFEHDLKINPEGIVVDVFQLKLDFPRPNSLHINDLRISSSSEDLSFILHPNRSPVCNPRTD